jgi:hypothetical protein
MKVLTSALSFIVLFAATCIAQQKWNPQPSQRMPPGIYYAPVHDDIVPMPDNIDLLIRSSDLIIDCKIEKLLSSALSSGSGPMVATYFSVSVNQVILGELPEKQKTLAIQERGGSAEGYEIIVKENPLVKPGEHYILFLRDKGPSLDFILGMPCYYAVGQYAGKAQITQDGKIQFLPSAAKTLHSYDGQENDKFIATINERIKVIEFPPKNPFVVKRPSPGTLPPMIGTTKP